MNEALTHATRFLLHASVSSVFVGPKPLGLIPPVARTGPNPLEPENEATDPPRATEFMTEF